MGAHRCRSSGVSNPRGGLQGTAPARGIHGVFGLAREAPDPWGQLQRPSQGCWAWRRGRGAPGPPGRAPQAGSGCEEHTQPEFTPPSPGRPAGPAPHPGLSLRRAGGPLQPPLPSPPRPAASARLQGDCAFLHPREARASEVPMLQFLERFPVAWAELRPQTVGLAQKPSSVAFHQTTGKENERP